MKEVAGQILEERSPWERRDWKQDFALHREKILWLITTETSNAWWWWLRHSNLWVLSHLWMWYSNPVTYLLCTYEYDLRRIPNGVLTGLLLKQHAQNHECCSVITAIISLQRGILAHTSPFWSKYFYTHSEQEWGRANHFSRTHALCFRKGILLPHHLFILCQARRKLVSFGEAKERGYAHAQKRPRNVRCSTPSCSFKMSLSPVTGKVDSL